LFPPILQCSIYITLMPPLLNLPLGNVQNFPSCWKYLRISKTGQYLPFKSNIIIYLQICCAKWCRNTVDMLTLDRKLHKKNKNIFLLILCLVLQFKNNKAEYSVNKSGTSHVRVSVVYLINILFLVEQILLWISI
jgi:hypothetical protein